MHAMTNLMIIMLYGLLAAAAPLYPRAGEGGVAAAPEAVAGAATEVWSNTFSDMEKQIKEPTLKCPAVIIIFARGTCDSG